MGTSTHIHVDHNTQRDPIQASSSTFTLVSSDTCIHSTYLHQFFKMPPKSTTTKPKAASEHASYQDMITDAIVNLKDRNGSRYDYSQCLFGTSSIFRRVVCLPEPC